MGLGEKISNILKIVFSSIFLWPSLLLTYFIFMLINYLLMKYLYKLMLINPDFLFFWKPQGYLYNLHGHYQGPMPITSVLYFILLIIFLYFSNYKKVIKVGSEKKALIYFIAYLIIIFPEERASPGPMTRFIDGVSYSPIENYMKASSRNFITGMANTPMGSFKMYKKSNSLSDNLYMRELKCQINLKKGTQDGCVDYPYLKYNHYER